MKQNNILSLVLSAALAVLFVGCDEFLDTMPDNRATIDSNQKVAELLVSAYPTVDPMMMYEPRTDNTIDNGAKQGTPNINMWEDYNWRINTDTEWDGPEALWKACYEANSAANQAIEAMNSLGRTEENDAHYAEALMCRAYAHFLLANTFCKPYDEATADTDLGIPYITEPEKKIGVKSERGTLRETYEAIEKDILEAMPLIDDNLYVVAKYHFNKKAAMAFAARFYLYYCKWDKAYDYANRVLGEDPSVNLRQLFDYKSMPQATEWRDRFISVDESCNIMLVALRSRWGRNYYKKRLGSSNDVQHHLGLRSPGPYGSLLPAGDLMFGGSSWPTKYHPKYHEIFEYTNLTARTGQPHVVQMAFTTDETLLVRAEAETMMGKLEEAARDLSYYYVAKGGIAVSAEDIIDYYKTLETTERNQVEKDALSPWLVCTKELHPKFALPQGDGLYILYGVLHMRQWETMWSGLRWLDIRRYGIEITHYIDGEDPITLPVDDPRRVIQIPQSVLSQGMTPNPQ